MEKYDTDKIRYFCKDPLGIKSCYLISTNDLLNNQFLKQTSLLDLENFSINLNNRINEINKICKILHINLDFCKSYQSLYIEDYKLIDTLKTYLPHLII